MRFQEDPSDVESESENYMKAEKNNKGKRFFSSYQSSQNLNKDEKADMPERASKLYRCALLKFCRSK